MSSASKSSKVLLLLLLLLLLQLSFSSLGFEYVAGDKPIVAAKDSAGLKYRMAEVTELAKEFMPKIESRNPSICCVS